MEILLIAIFVLIAAVAAGFVVWPILRSGEDSRARRAVLAAAAALLVLGAGGGVYLELGSPTLALRALTGPKPNDLPGLVDILVQRVHQHPNELMAWTLLGRGYMTLNDPGDAVGAFRHAAELAPPDKQPGLLSNFGEALVLSHDGQVPKEAEAAFKAALQTDPSLPSARYYLGLAYANRRETEKALNIWQSLLDEAPPSASYRPMLVDRIAALKAGAVANGTAKAPNIAAMVARLAARLKAQPNDPAGWQRLIRAYSVLGQKDKARAALASARTALKGNPAALSAIMAEAKSVGLGS
jgi:cytochrome c-type biogenesis protein CcmH